jgi:hypothetical protein
MAGDLQQVAAPEWFTARKDEGLDSSLHCLVYEVTTLCGRQFVTSGDSGVLIAVGATEIASLGADPVDAQERVGGQLGRREGRLRV